MSTPRWAHENGYNTFIFQPIRTRSMLPTGAIVFVIDTSRKEAFHFGRVTSVDEGINVRFRLFTMVPVSNLVADGMQMAHVWRTGTFASDQLLRMVETTKQGAD